MGCRSRSSGGGAFGRVIIGSYLKSFFGAQVVASPQEPPPVIPIITPSSPRAAAPPPPLLALHKVLLPTSGWKLPGVQRVFNCAVSLSRARAVARRYIRRATPAIPRHFVGWPLTCKDRSIAHGVPTGWVSLCPRRPWNGMGLFGAGGGGWAVVGASASPIFKNESLAWRGAPHVGWHGCRCCCLLEGFQPSAF